MEKFKQFFRSFDMFSSLPTLRAKSHPQTNNACGGMLSIVAIGLFTYLFISQSYSVLTYQQISSTQTIQNKLQNTYEITDFMVGIGIQGFNTTSISPFIRFQFVEVTLNGTNFVSFRSLQKEVCTVQHLSALGDNAQQSYVSFNMKDKYCLKSGQNITINKMTSNSVYKILSVTANSCLKKNYQQQNIYQNCANTTQFQYGNLIWISLHKYFTTNVVYINTGFQPNDQTATTKYADVIRSTFTLKRGTQTLVYLSPYEITTDTSILPYINNTIQDGYTFDRTISDSYEAVDYFEMINVYFTLSDKNIKINRTLGKIDQILSYVGGLFGIVIALLTFFMISFNQYRYQLMVAEGAFNYSDDGTKIKQHDFHFLQYVKYSLYDWINTLCCFQLNWKNCKQIDQTRQQANKQLDVTLLFKKIQHFEKVIEYLINQRQNISIYLTQPPSIDEVRRTRRIAEYYQKIIKGKAATTVQDIQNGNTIFNFAMNQISGGNSKAQLVIRNTNSKRRLYEQPGQQRQNILQRILQQFKQDFIAQDVQLDQQEQKVQLQIAQAFFRMEQKARKKIQEKIPLKILYRLKKRYESTISKQSMIINLQI